MTLALGRATTTEGRRIAWAARRADGSRGGSSALRLGGAVLASIVADVATGGPARSRVTDVRDRQIGRLGDYIGQSFVVIGAVAAMLMAMADWERFWIANVIYLGFALSAVLGSVAKIGLYRGTFPQW